MIKLKEVTLVCITSVHINESISSILHSSKEIEFGKIKLITSENVAVNSIIDVEKCRKLTSLQDYGHFVIYELYKHIDTEFCLIVQHDGKVTNPNLWNPQFLEYDYIGAPWPLPGTDWMPNRRYMNASGEILDSFSNKYRVGNGGFSIRSKKLLTTPNRISISMKDCVSEKGYFYTPNEDWNICIYNRHLYEKDGNVFAPYDVSNIFSKEWGSHKTFGKHR